MAFEIRGKWLTSYQCVECRFQDLFKTALSHSHLAFSLSVLLESRWCYYTVVTTWPGNKFGFILSDHFGLVLWHVNHSRLFNAWSFYTYISNMIAKQIFLDNCVKKSNVFKYCYLTLTIQTSVICLQLNDQTVRFQTIQFSISQQR